MFVSNFASDAVMCELLQLTLIFMLYIRDVVLDVIFSYLFSIYKFCTKYCCKTLNLVSVVLYHVFWAFGWGQRRVYQLVPCLDFCSEICLKVVMSQSVHIFHSYCFQFSINLILSIFIGHETFFRTLDIYSFFSQIASEKKVLYN